ncbi:hypothetical protein ACF068_14425 [Streptomyces sp. NPDC016309]
MSDTTNADGGKHGGRPSDKPWTPPTPPSPGGSGPHKYADTDGS